MYYLFQTEALASNVDEQMTLVHETLPVVYVELTMQQICQAVEQLERLLNRLDIQIEQQEQQYTANTARLQWREMQRKMRHMEADIRMFMQNRTKENAIHVYGEIVSLFEFAAKQIVIRNEDEVETLANTRVTETQVAAFFTQCFQMTPTIRTGRITDVVGVTETALSFYFMETAVLYNFKTMFRKQDVPNVVLDFASYTVRNVVRGKTSSVVADHAMQRIIEGMAYRPVGLFAFQATPFATCMLEMDTLPIVKDRERLVVQKVKTLTIQRAPGVHYRETNGGRVIEEVSSDFTPFYERMEQATWLVQRFSFVRYTKQDVRHLPIPVRAVPHVPDFVDAECRDLSTAEQAFYAMLTREFMRRSEEKGCAASL